MYWSAFSGEPAFSDVSKLASKEYLDSQTDNLDNEKEGDQQTKFNSNIEKIGNTMKSTKDDAQRKKLADNINRQTGKNDKGQNIQYVGNIKFDSNKIENKKDKNGNEYLIVTALDTGKKYGVIRKDDGTYEFKKTNENYMNRYYNYKEWEMNEGKRIDENLLSKALNFAKETVDNLRRTVGFAATSVWIKSTGTKQDAKFLQGIADGFEKSGIEGSANTMDAKQMKEMFEYLRKEIKSKNIKNVKELILKIEEIVGFKIA